MPPSDRSPQDISVELDRFLDQLVGRPPYADALTGRGVVSAWYGDTAGTPFWTRDADAPHYAASTMKLPLLVAAYRRADRGELDLSAEVTVHNRFASAADGSVFSLDRAEDQDDQTWAALGGRVTLGELAERAVVHSGNLATNLLLERVGVGEMAQVLVEAGCSTDTVLVRGIEDTVARDSGFDNLVTSADLATVMVAVAARSLAADSTCAEIERVLSRQRHRDKIPAGLPPDTYVANKTGWVDGVAHDVALVRPASGEAYVLAVCTTLAVPEPAANALIAGISRAVWTAHTA